MNIHSTKDAKGFTWNYAGPKHGWIRDNPGFALNCYIQENLWYYEDDLYWEHKCNMEDNQEICYCDLCTQNRISKDWGNICPGESFTKETK